MRVFQSGKAVLLLLPMLLAGCGLFSSTPPTRAGYKVGNPYQIAGVWYYPREDYAYDETGIASWYGPGFHARSTANGETFDQDALTAAHNTLQMPAIVRVTNLENGRQIVLRVNDRGPFANGRILDVSRRSAQLLGFDRNGTARVRVQVLETESRQAALQAQNRGGGAQLQMAAAPRSTVTADTLAPPPGARQSGNVRVAAANTRGTAADALATPDAAPARMPENVAQVAARPGSIYVQAGAFQRRENADRLRDQLGGFQPQVTRFAAAGQQSLYRVRIGPLDSVQTADTTLNRVFHSGVSEARIVVE